ncbi:MAG: tripartite tricarboxylate transporter TctB family protein [Pseudomonadota bacterium]
MPPDTVRRGTDTIYGIVSFSIALILFIHTYSERYEINHLFGDVSTVLVPRILLGSWMFLSAILVIRDSLSLAVFADVQWRNFVLIGAIASLIVGGLWLFGFLVTMPFGLFALGWAFGYRRWVVLLIVSIAAPLAVWLVLSYLAAVPLPDARIQGLF